MEQCTVIMLLLMFEINHLIGGGEADTTHHSLWKLSIPQCGSLEFRVGWGKILQASTELHQVVFTWLEINAPF